MSYSGFSQPTGRSNQPSSFFSGYTGQQIRAAYPFSPGSVAGGAPNFASGSYIQSSASDFEDHGSDIHDPSCIEVRQSRTAEEVNAEERGNFTVGSNERPLPNTHRLLRQGVPQRRNGGRPSRPRSSSEAESWEGSSANTSSAWGPVAGSSRHDRTPGFIQELGADELDAWVASAPANSRWASGSLHGDVASGGKSTASVGGAEYENPDSFMPERTAPGYPLGDVVDQFSSLFPNTRGPEEALRPEVPQDRWRGMDQQPGPAGSTRPQPIVNHSRCEVCSQMTWNITAGSCVSAPIKASTLSSGLTLVTLHITLTIGEPVSPERSDSKSSRKLCMPYRFPGWS